MALEGSIKDISLAAIFQLIGMERKTGVLTLHNKEEEITVTFLNGLVVNADSKDKRVDQRLGGLLVKSGKLSEEQLKRVLKIQKDTLRKLGLVLLQEKLITSEDLRDALQIQITQVIFRLFRWREGDYQFQPETKIEYDKDFFQPMSTESLLMEGMRMIDEWPIIERKIPSLAIVFEMVPVENEIAATQEAGPDRPTPDMDEDFHLVFGETQQQKVEEPSSKIRLSREEGAVYGQVDGQRSVRDIIDRTMLSEFETCRALYDLLNRNLIVQRARGTRAIEGKKARKDALPSLVKAFYPLLGLFVAASPLAMRFNPLNLLAVPLPDGPHIAGIRENLNPNALDRVRMAVRTYRIAEGDFPADLRSLVDAGLLSESDLVDPWGRPYEYARIEGGGAQLAGAALVR